MLYTIEEIMKSGTYLSDGAWGTEFAKKDIRRGIPNELLNEIEPDLVRAVAESYVAVGSDIILTNTFGANRILLSVHGYGDKVRELNRRGVEISRDAAAGKALVFASLGPTGKMIVMGISHVMRRRRCSASRQLPWRKRVSMRLLLRRWGISRSTPQQ